MALPAKRLQPGEAVRVLLRLLFQRLDMVRLKPSSPPAQDTTPAVPVVTGDFRSVPARRVKPDMIARHA